MVAYPTPPTAADDDQDRIASAVGGDRRAIEELLVEWFPKVRNLVRYLVRRDDEVDDIAQEALARILRSLPNYQSEGAFGGWVGRIVARTAIDFARRRKDAVGREDDVREHAALEASSDHLEGLMERRRVVKLLADLPDGQHQAFVLHHVVEMSVPEIAKELGVSIETVRSRLRLARRRLRERGLTVDETSEGEGVR